MPRLSERVVERLGVVAEGRPAGGVDRQLGTLGELVLEDGERFVLDAAT